MRFRPDAGAPVQLLWAVGSAVPSSGHDVKKLASDERERVYVNDRGT